MVSNIAKTLRSIFMLSLIVNLKLCQCSLGQSSPQKSNHAYVNCLSLTTCSSPLFFTENSSGKMSDIIDWKGQRKDTHSSVPTHCKNLHHVSLCFMMFVQCLLHIQAHPRISFQSLYTKWLTSPNIYFHLLTKCTLVTDNTLPVSSLVLYRIAQAIIFTVIQLAHNKA